MATERFANSAQTTLAAGVSAGDLSITVVSNANFPSQPQFRVRVGDELMLVTAGTAGTSWAVTRGYEGTAAAAHAGGTPVTQVLTAGALGNLLPDQAGNAGKFLTTDGSDPSWATVSAGTVTSVGLTVPSFLSVTGSPVTGSGTLAVSLSGTALPVANGGTGQTSAAAAINALLPTQTGNGGEFLTTDGSAASWSPLPAAPPLNQLVNTNFLRIPRQARATLTAYANASLTASYWLLYSSSGATNQQVRNWSQGDGSPPVAFTVLGPSYLQLKNNAGSAVGVALCQFVEANGPNGVSAALLQAQQVAAAVSAVASTGTPTLKIAVREWRGSVDAPTKPIASWTSNVPTFQTTNHASVATGSAALNTSTATQVACTGTASSSCVGLFVIVWVEGLAAGASVYLSQASLVRGAAAPAAWAPHPSDEELCGRYFRTSYPSGTAPGATTVFEGAPTCIGNGTMINVAVQFGAKMRAAPSVTTYNPSTGATGSFRDGANTATVAATAQTIGDGGLSIYGFTATVSTNFFIHYTASAEVVPT